jgi:L-alanine-DL-glutamate epimerase-like enolase superfamily enzyme
MFIELVSGGCIGVGEVAFSPSWEILDPADFAGFVSVIDVWSQDHLLNTLQAVLVGDVSRASLLLDQLLPEQVRVRCGLANAIFDLAAQLLNCSVAKILGVESREEISVNALVSLDANERLKQGYLRLSNEIDQHCLIGIRTIKIKGTGDIYYDLELLQRLSDRFYSQVRFRIDPNGRWCHRTYRRLISFFPTEGLEYIEEPFSSIECYEHAQSLLPIALDHWGSDLSQLKAHIALVESYKIRIVAVVIKCQALGGVDRAIHIIKFLEALNIRPVVTGSLETLVGLKLAAELASCCHHDWATGIMLWNYIRPNTHSIPIVNEGRVPIPLVKGNPSFSSNWTVNIQEYRY